MLEGMDQEAAVYLVLLMMMACFAGGLLIAVMHLSHHVREQAAYGRYYRARARRAERDQAHDDTPEIR